MIDTYTIVIIVLIILAIVLYYKQVNYSEHMTPQSNEAVQNVASLYNTANLTATNINATGSLTSTGSLVASGPATIAGTLQVGNNTLTPDGKLSLASNGSIYLPGNNNMDINGLHLGSTMGVNTTGSGDVLNVFPNRDGKPPYYFIGSSGTFGIWDGKGIPFYIDNQGRQISNPSITWKRGDNVDFSGRDIRNFTTQSRDDCEAACANNPTCTHATYNTNNSCFLKRLDNKGFGGDEVLGTKRPDNSFIRYPYFDINGFDYQSGIKVNGLLDCENRCASDSNCWAYGYYPSSDTCNLKKPNNSSGLYLSQKS
jgi:hypothetical protein